MKPMVKKIIAAIFLLMVWGLLYSQLHQIVDFIVFGIFNLKPETAFTQSVYFFLYEVPKILLLLCLIISGVGILRTYFSPEKTRKFLAGKSLLAGNILAAFLGVLTPFCSCSAIPLFLGFVEAGIPLGVTFSFLIAAPMINEVALVLLFGLFGWKVAIIYVVTGLLIAILSGWVIEKLNLQRYLADWVYKTQVKTVAYQEEKLPFSKRIEAGVEVTKEIIGKIWIYVIIGIAIGAGAHGYVPEDYLSSLLGKDNWYAIPLAILVGIPLYSNAAGIIPIVGVLIEKGVSLGTALAFMMSVIALSLPEIIILKKVLKWPLIAAFVTIVSFGILVVGYVFNYLLFI